MSVLKEIEQKESGASFRRADIHIHSYGLENGSYDVTDESMTPKAIVDLAIEENLEVISITDHNEISNSIDAFKYAEDKNLLVLLGIEVSTVNGHLLVYFPSVDKLKKFHSLLNIDFNKEQCQESMTTCLDLAASNDGVCIAAHIDSDKGFVKEVGKYNNVMRDIVTHKNLLGIEIKSRNSKDWFSNNDSIPERVNFLKERNSILNLEEFHSIAKVMNSDAHKLSSLGKNSQGDKKITRLKMDRLTFESFLIALRDPDSRVRIEELIPGSIPYFYGLKTEGGFLGEQYIKFSKNLNSIIGGRGAGKSTLIQSIQSGSGNLKESKLLDSDAWPSRIRLYLVDENNNMHEYIKDKYQDELVYQGDEEERPARFNIETYNQGKTAEIIRNAKEDASALLNYFDEFIDFGDLKSQEEFVRRKILEQQSKVDFLRDEVNRIPEIKEQLNKVERKLEFLQRKKLGDLIAWETNLQEGKKFREDLEKDLNKAIDTVIDGLSDKTLLNQITEQDVGELKIGKKEHEKILKSISEIIDVLDSSSDNIKSEWKEVKQEIKKQMTEWRRKESTILDKIEIKKNELERRGIKFDLAYIRQLTQAKAKYKKILSKLKTHRKEYKKELKILNSQYKQRLILKSNIYNRRLEWVTKVNDYLNSTIKELKIKIKIEKGNRSEQLTEYLMELIGFHNPKTPKIKNLIKEFGVKDLQECIRRKNIQKIKSIEYDGERIFSKSEVEKVSEIVLKPEVADRLMTIQYDDYPEIFVSKEITNQEGKKSHSTRDFTNLSLGQQHSVMLSILLYSENKYPLLIDQPEDNLDSEFIYSTIVSNLKRVKEMRQVIIVTHNANIAVLGDSELLIPLKSTSDKAFVLDRGSIDNDATIKRTCSILEGSRKAFKKRQHIYNIK